MSTIPQPASPLPRPPLLTRRLPWLLLLIVLAIIYYASYLRCGINFHDDGATFALNAKRLLDGEVPFRDVELGYNVGWFYPVVGLFKLFGVNFVLLRGYCFALSVLTAVLAFLTVERVSRQVWLAFVVSLLLVLVPGMTFKNYMPLLAVANIWCLVHFALGRRPRQVLVATSEGTVAALPVGETGNPSWGWLVAGAFVLGLTFLIRIDVGFFFLLIWLGGEWLLALRPLASPGARMGLLIGGPIVTLALATAVHVPVYLDAVKRGFDKPFVLRYQEWPAQLLRSLEERLHPAPAIVTPALPGHAALHPTPAPTLNPAPAPADPALLKPDAPVLPPSPVTPDAGLPKTTPVPSARPPVPSDLDTPKPPPVPAPDAAAPAPPALPAPAKPEPSTPPPCAVPSSEAPTAPKATAPDAPATVPAKEPVAPSTEVPVPASPAPPAATPAPPESEPYIVFKSVNGDPQKPESLDFQISTSAMGRGSRFLRLGDPISETKFKLERFEPKTSKSLTGDDIDVSELTLLNTETGARVVLVLGKRAPFPAAVAAPVAPVPPPDTPAPAVPLPPPAPAPVVPPAPAPSETPAQPATSTALVETPKPAAPAAVHLEKEANWNTHGLRPKTLADLNHQGWGDPDIARANVLILLRYLPLYVLVALALWAFFASLLAWRSSEPGAMNRPVAALLVIGGALTIFPQYFFWRSDAPHISEFMPGYWVAAFSAAFLLGWSDLRRTSWVTRTVACLFLVALCAHASLYLWRMMPERWTGTIAAWGTYQRKGHKPWRWNARNDTLFRGENGVNVYVSKKEAEALEELRKVVQAHSGSPGDYLVAYPYHPQINLLLNRRTYEKNVYVDNATCGRGWNEAAIARIQKYRPNVIVLSDWDINDTEESRFSVWGEKTKTWIQTNYLFQTKLLEFEIYTRPEKEQ